MKNKYVFLFLFSICLLGLVAACSNDTDYTFKGRNYIQITTADDPSLSENDERVITVDVLLATTVEKDATINFELSDNMDNILRLEDAPVFIKAGGKKASFKVLSNRQSLLNTQKVFTVRVKDASDSRMQAWNELKLTVKPNPTLPELTGEQIEWIHGYMEKYGLNLNRFIGVVNCHVEVTFPSDEIGIFSDTEIRSFEGKSMITLSENATAERPILKMIDNPMGLVSLLWDIFKKETIEDSEVWTAQEFNRYMAEAVNFKPDEETFSAVLDNLELLPGDHSISFTAPITHVSGDPEYNDEILTVPFEYSFSAWERWKKMADEGKKISIPEGDNFVETSVADLLQGYVTLEPRYYLVTSPLDEDNWENEPSDWIEPKGMFNEKTFSFQFPWDHTNSLGYTQIRVTYTLNE